MKIHGNIEASIRRPSPDIDFWYPWMKIHGNIEAQGVARLLEINADVSMDENPWQHWSQIYIYNPNRNSTSIHGWKSMATLKHDNPDEWNRAAGRYPWMKIHGNIEAKGGGGENDRIHMPVSMDENPWQHWSKKEIGKLKVISSEYPWMKIHGNIEAH